MCAYKQTIYNGNKYQNAFKSKSHLHVKIHIFLLLSNMQVMADYQLHTADWRSVMEKTQE